jgi:hypothetical protein
MCTRMHHILSNMRVYERLRLCFSKKKITSRALGSSVNLKIQDNSENFILVLKMGVFVILQ